MNAELSLAILFKFVWPEVTCAPSQSSPTSQSGVLRDYVFDLEYGAKHCMAPTMVPFLVPNLVPSMVPNISYHVWYRMLCKYGTKYGLRCLDVWMY